MSKGMLGDALRRRAAESPVVGSKVDAALADLDDDDRELLLEALRSSMPHRAIARALSDIGYQMSEKAVASWRESHPCD